MHPSLNRTQHTLTFLASFIAALTIVACELRLQIPSTTDAPNFPKYEFEATGEDYLISALEEVQAIADWSQFYRNEPSTILSDNTSGTPRMTLAKTATDTVYIYGQVIPGGYGAVVTERYARPKGLLLITVRKTYGKANGHIVTETKRYVSYTDHRNGNPEQTNVTEMYGRQADTIVAHVLRNGTLETYTFRLPVVTRVVNPQDGSVRVTKRYASNGAIVSKVEDANGNLIQLSRNYGQSDGSTVTRTEFPDSSWRQVRTHGEADGTITRETTSGLPSLGSGASPSPTNIPRPVMSMWMPPRSSGNFHGTNPGESMQDMPFLASGVNPMVPKPPRPRSTHSDVTKFVSIASGQGFPGPVPRPVMSFKSLGHSRTEAISTITHRLPSARSLHASGVTGWQKPPRPILASGNSVQPKPPLSNVALFPSQSPKARPHFTTEEGAASGSQSLCSGCTQPMRPPPPPPLA